MTPHSRGRLQPSLSYCCQDFLVLLPKLLTQPRAEGAETECQAANSPASEKLEEIFLLKLLPFPRVMVA